MAEPSNKVDRMLTADQKTMLALSKLKPSTTSDLTFRDSLVEQYNRKGDLSTRQWHHARELLKRYD